MSNKTDATFYDGTQPNDTVAYVTEMPMCQVHVVAFPGQPSHVAEYDFRLRTGRWAYGCESCWKMARMHTDLGVGKGQKLEIYKDPEEKA